MDKKLLFKIWIFLLIATQTIFIYSAFTRPLYLSFIFLLQIVFSVIAIYISLSSSKQKMRFSKVLLIFGIICLMITLIIGIGLTEPLALF